MNFLQIKIKRVIWLPLALLLFSSCASKQPKVPTVTEPPPYLNTANSTKKEEPLVPPVPTPSPIVEPAKPTNDTYHIGLYWEEQV